MTAVSSYIAYARALNRLGWTPAEFAVAESFVMRLRGMLGRRPVAANGLPPQQEGGFIGLANVRQRVESIARGRLHFSSIKNKGATVTVVLPKER